MLIDWFTVGAQALNFLILIWLLKRFLYRPVLAAIEARGDLLLARLDGRQNRSVEKALQQPDQDQKIERLRTDGEPVDEHGYFPEAAAMK